MTRSPQPGKTRGLTHGSEGMSPPTAAQQRYQLILLSGARRGMAVDLDASADAPLRIGSGADNDLVIDDDTVSRHHCLLVHEKESWVLRDLRSTNGSFVDDARVKEAYVRSGATLRLGQALLRFASAYAKVTLPPSTQERFGSLVGKSVRMREVFAVLERVSRTDATVLITGETGTGKGAVARAIHEKSKRTSEPFVVVDCGAVASTLIESELFGHEKGAFTGAVQRRPGALEHARGGTLFLDELDDLRKDLQPKLLRALEERTFKRLGSQQPISLEARVIGATKKDLRALVAQGAFREDLYFRIAVLHLLLPPLRERKEDLPGLIDRFALALGEDGAFAKLTPEERDRLLGHTWPGNVRELRNAVERAFALADPEKPGAVWSLETELSLGEAAQQPHFELPFKEAKDRLLESFEREYLRQLLARTGGKVVEAARLAEIDRKHLYNLMQKYAL